MIRYRSRSIRGHSKHMKFPFRSRYSAWKRRRAVRALSRIDRKCLKMRKSLLFSSSHFDHVQSIAPTAGGKTSYLSFLKERPQMPSANLGYPIRNYLPTSPGSMFVLGGGMRGVYDMDIVSRYPEKLTRHEFINQYYGKGKNVTDIYCTDTVGIYEDEYGNPVHIKARKKPVELGSISGYDVNGEIVWTAELVVRFGTDGREQWISTNVKLGSFLVHIDAKDAIKYHLDPHFMSKTYHIGARTKIGQSYKTVYLHTLVPGKQADLAYAELTKNG